MDTTKAANNTILKYLLNKKALQTEQNSEDIVYQTNNTEPTDSSGNQEHVLSIFDSIDPSKTEAIIVYDSDTENERDNNYQLFVDLDEKSLPTDDCVEIRTETPPIIQEHYTNLDESSWNLNVDSLISSLSSNVDSVKIVKRANKLKSKIRKQKMPKNVDPKLVMRTLISLVKLDHQPIWKRIRNGRVTLTKSSYKSKSIIHKLLKMEEKGKMIRDSKNWVVVLERLPAHVLERFAGGGYSRRAGPVRLPDIEQVRREHGRMLTAQVKPLAASRARGSVPPSALSCVTKGLCHGSRLLTLVPVVPEATNNTGGATDPPAAREPTNETSIPKVNDDVGTSENKAAAKDVITTVRAQTGDAINERSTTERESNAPSNTQTDDGQNGAPVEVPSDFNTSYKHFVQQIAALKQLQHLKKQKGSHTNHEPYIPVVSSQKARSAKKIQQKPSPFNTIIRLTKDVRAQKPNMRMEAQREASSDRNNSEIVPPDVVDLTDNEDAVALDDALKPAVVPNINIVQNPPNTIAPPRTLAVTNMVPTPAPPVHIYTAPQTDNSLEQNRSFIGQIVNRNGVPSVVINNSTQYLNQNRYVNVPAANNINVSNNLEVQNQPQIMTVPQNKNVVQGYPMQNVGNPMFQFQQISDEMRQHNRGHSNVIFTPPNFAPLRPNLIRTDQNNFPQLAVDSETFNPVPTENAEVQNLTTLNLPAGSYLILSPNLNQPNVVNVIRHNAVTNTMPTMEYQMTNEQPMEQMPLISDVRSLAVNERFNTAEDSGNDTVEYQVETGERRVEAMETDADEASSFVPGPTNPLELYASTPKNARDVLASASAMVLVRVPRRTKLWTLDTGYLVFTDSVLSLGEWSMFALTPRSVCALVRGGRELSAGELLKCRPLCLNNARRFVLVVPDDINPEPDSEEAPPTAPPAAPSQERPRIKVKAFASLDNFNNRARDRDVRNSLSNNTHNIRDEDRVTSLYAYNTYSSNKDKNSTLNTGNIDDGNKMDGTICNKDANIVINANKDVNNGDTDKVNTLKTGKQDTESTSSVNKENKNAVGTDIISTVVTNDPNNINTEVMKSGNTHSVNDSDIADNNTIIIDISSDSSTDTINTIECSPKMDIEDSKTDNGHSDSKKSSHNSEMDSDTSNSNSKNIDKLKPVNENKMDSNSNSVDSVSAKPVNSDKMENLNNSNVSDKNDVNINTEVKNNTNMDLNTIDANKLNSSSMNVDSLKKQCFNKLNINNYSNTDHSYSKKSEVVNINNIEPTKNTDNDSLENVDSPNMVSNSSSTGNTVNIESSPTIDRSSEVEISDSGSAKVNNDGTTSRKKRTPGDSNYLVVSDRKRNFFRISQEQNVYARMLSCVSTAQQGFNHAMRGFALLLYSAEDGRMFPVRACRRSRRLLCCLHHTKRGCWMCKSGDWRHLHTLQLVAKCFNEIDTNRPEWKCVF